MSKKIVVLIELVVCVAAVLFVSLFGIVAESWRGDKYVVLVQFVDDEGNYAIVETMYDKNDAVTTDENLCVRKQKTIELEPNKTTLQLKWIVETKDSTRPEVAFETNQNSVTVSKDGLVENITKRVVVTISSTDGTNLRDSVLIVPNTSTSGGTIVL